MLVDFGFYKMKIFWSNIARKTLVRLAIIVAISTLDLVISSATATALEKVSLQLRWDHQFQFAGYYAAKWQGFYKEAGLDVEIRPGVTAERKVLDAVKEVSEGRADFGIGSADILLALDRGVPLRITASIFQQSPVAIIARTEDGLISPADLSRLRVRRTIDDFLDVEFRAVLKAEGIDLSDITSIVEGERGRPFSLLKEGKIDAYAGYTLTALWRAKSEGVSISLLRPAAYGVDFYGDSLFTHERIINNNSDLVERFTAASLKGWEYALEHPEEISDRITSELTRQFKVKNIKGFNRFQIKEVTKLSLHPVIKLGHINPERWYRMNEIMKESGLVSLTLDPSSLIFDPGHRKEQSQILFRNILLAIIGVAGISLLGFFIINLVLRRQVAARTMELSSAKTLLDKAFSSLDDVILVVDPHTLKIIDCNDAVERLFGYRKEEFVGMKTSLIHVNQEMHEKFTGMLLPALEADGVFRTEFKMRRKDATEFPVDITITEIKNADGERTQIVGVARDITERKQSEIALQESEKRFRLLFETAGSAIVILSSDRRIVEFNPKAEEIFGVSKEDIIGENYFELFLPVEIHEQVGEAMDKVLAGEPALGYENPVTTPNGVTRHLIWNSTRLLDADGNPAFSIAIGQDITERKQSESALQEAHNELEQRVDERTKELRESTANLRKLSSAIEQSPNAVFITDLSGAIEYVNPRFTELTGYSAEESLGQNPRILKSDETPKELYSDLWKTIRKGDEWKGEMKDQRKNGSHFWAHETIAPVKDENGVITHYVATHEDITERKEAELTVQFALEQAQVANRAKSDLMANMSHELRTPLNAIIGFSESMKEETFGSVGSDKNREYLNDIQNSGQHLLELINDILDVSAIEADALELDEENVNFADVVDASIRIIGPRAETGQVKITSSIDPKIPLIYVDERRVKQVLLNLLSNAVKFTPEGGEVSVNVSLNDGGSLVAAVADNGIGMDKEEMTMALSTFGQVDSGLDRKHEGTGLGLPLTKRLMELHGGTMEIKSEKGHGTSIMVIFPKERVI
ncbi:MAG: PAS domain S-box protein [Rhodospirillaceae bacterium]|nr:PAS domain S-box protein [Rhodospirillaceae bacterium]